MVYFRILSLLLIFFGLSARAQVTGILINGSFYDDSTGLDLPTRVYAVTGNKKILLGESVREQIFNHRFNIRLKPDTDSLSFESEGYFGKTLKLNFHDAFTRNTTAHLGIKTLKYYDVNLDLSLIVFCETYDVDYRYKTLHYIGDRLHCDKTGLALPREVKNRDISQKFYNSKYIIQTFSLNNNLVSEVEVKVLPGINLVDVGAYSKEAAARTIVTDSIINDTSALRAGVVHDINSFRLTDSFQETEEKIKPHPFDSLGFSDLFFEQGEYVLTAKSIEILKEISTYLKQRELNWKIIIKGYTDGVGDKALNETLAAYRARIVYNFLIENGVSPEIFLLEWQREGNMEREGGDLSKFRKVTLKKDDKK